MSLQGGKLEARVGQNELRSWMKFHVCVCSRVLQLSDVQ